MRIGEHFVKHQIANEEQIKKALEIQSKSGGKIGEILLAMANMRAIDYYKIIAKHYHLDFIDLLKTPIDPAVLKIENKEKYFADMSLPIAFSDGNYSVATADPSPETFEKIRQEYGKNTRILSTSKFDILWTLQKQFNDHYLESSIHDLAKKNARLSAKYNAPYWLKIIYLSLFLGFTSLFFFNIKAALLITNCVILFGLSFIVFFKIALSIIGLCARKKKMVDPADINEEELPVYSILVALYKENQTTLNNLFSSLKKIIYPAHKLDIKILLEDDDHTTIQIIKKMRLPSYIEFIYVPASNPRTKAKACNYGFQFIRGKYLCLYDAEDKPDPDQLIRVIQLFKESNNEKLACVQCRLNFYNSNENWLTRMFTIEYTYWFNLLLPALERTHIPIPLGGTSNHFRTDILREVVGWDPFNVTEDADLGLRLSRLGYLVKILDSTTYEEANCQLWNWIKQRTRWVKGYMQTYLVHMRNPFELWRKIGTPGFFGFQLFIGGTILSNLTNIPMWLISLTLVFLPQWDVSYYFPGKVHDIALLNLYVGTLGIILLNVCSIISHKNWKLLFSAFTSPIYWLLMSAASYRALYQLIFSPSYWDKTQHGISTFFENNSASSQELIDMKNFSKSDQIKFGTFGLEINKEKLTDKIYYQFTLAFLQYLELNNKISENCTIIVGSDDGVYSDHIVKVIVKAINDKSFSAEYCGNIPTDALIDYSLLHASPSIMITDTQIKFYSHEGEITQSDVEGILSQSINIDSELFDKADLLNKQHLYWVPISFEAMTIYKERLSRENI